MRTTITKKSGESDSCYKKNEGLWLLVLRKEEVCLKRDCFSIFLKFHLIKKIDNVKNIVMSLDDQMMW